MTTDFWTIYIGSLCAILTTTLIFGAIGFIAGIVQARKRARVAGFVTRPAPVIFRCIECGGYFDTPLPPVVVKNGVLCPMCASKNGGEPFDLSEQPAVEQIAPAALGLQELRCEKCGKSAGVVPTGIKVEHPLCHACQFRPVDLKKEDDRAPGP